MELELYNALKIIQIHPRGSKLRSLEDTGKSAQIEDFPDFLRWAIRDLTRKVSKNMQFLQIVSTFCAPVAT